MNIYELLGTAVLTVALTAILKLRGSPIAQHLSSVAVISILISTVTALSPMISYLKSLGNNTGIQSTAITAILKAVGISLLSQTVSDICNDNGEKALASAVEFSSNASILLLALPFIKTISDDVLGLLK